MPAKITTLIDKLDSSEIVRDQIAAILLLESQNQQVLASAANEDPSLWMLRIYTEASNPWEQFQDPPADGPLDPSAYTPLVNVCFDQAATDKASSSQINRKWVDGTFNVDCYGYGLSSRSEAGHVPGDTSAALEAQRAARLVRNILESAHYANLGLLKLVGDRGVTLVQSFQLPQDGKNASQVRGVRCVVTAGFNEYSPQFVGQPFEGATVTVTRSPSGAISVFDFNASAPPSP